MNSVSENVKTGNSMAGTHHIREAFCATLSDFAFSFISQAQSKTNLCSKFYFLIDFKITSVLIIIKHLIIYI